MSRRTLQISEFKTHCIQVVREVDRDRRPVTLTLRGKPIANVTPVARARVLGSMRDECVVHGELVHTDFSEEWEMNG